LTARIEPSTCSYSAAGDSRHTRRLPAIVGGLLAATALALVPGHSAHADPSLSVTTPYPAIETQPGSQVDLEFTVASTTSDRVDLELGELPEGWQATLRGGGFVIHSVTSQPEGAPVTLEIDVAPGTEPGEYPLTLTATDRTGGNVVTEVTLVVLDQVDAGISLTADFPSLTGEPGDTFSYQLTLTNDTPAEQSFTFDPVAPQGWDVSASPSAEARAETVTVEPGSTANVNVEAVAPATADQGEYPIEVVVTSADGGRGAVALTAEVVGTPVLQLATADERLNVSGQANSEQRIPLVVANTGTAELTDVKLAGTAPSGWEVSFDPQSIATVQPGETAQVTAIVKPSAESVAGDYAMTVRASAGSVSADTELRYTLKGSTTLGVVAIGVIVVAVAALAGVFMRFGRR
jgi:uncharacterized membrane protein